MSLLQNSIAASMIVAAFSMPAHAHFPWIVLTPQERPTQAAVYFGESATPDDPDLLDRIAHADVRLLSGWRSEPRPLELATTDDALVAELKDAAPASSAVLQLEYGVISRGGAPFLLKYYGKAHSSVLPGAWRTVGDADLLPLEITAQLEHTQLNLHVAWQGEAAPGVELTTGGPGLDENVTGTTDDAGNLRCELADSGLYSIRARHVEESAGEHDGQAYHQIRHYSTLTLHYARPMATTAEHSWPALPRGVTSFGAAVAGDWLYVYGGHLGGAHAYSADAQSGEFSRLNLAQPTEWEPLPGGPKRTGLAMVSHGGKLYRIGGFSALNSEGEDDNLVSQADVARFDPQSMQWETLPALPAGRSSLDAAVIGEAIYVVGGWNLQGDADAEWHDTALKLELSADPLEWREIAAPGFQRRALSLAGWQGQLYVIGGMESDGGPTTQVAVYDPQQDAWSDGPQLLGGAMDGFGPSAFATPEGLCATTMSGAIQELAGGNHWEFAGQLAQPRFFHRMLPWRSGLVVVGGADMSAGKRLKLERIPGR